VTRTQQTAAAEELAARQAARDTAARTNDESEVERIVAGSLRWSIHDARSLIRRLERHGYKVVKA
jgi:hypothetical protein